jgi:hypothetical protein
MCGTIDPGHTYDEYMVLLAKSGMTILFLHLLSINHKFTQPCYFPLLLKLAAQKLKKTLEYYDMEF